METKKTDKINEIRLPSMHQVARLVLYSSSGSPFDKVKHSSPVPTPTRQVLVEEIENSPAPQVVRQTASHNKLVVIEKLRSITVHDLPSLKPCQPHVFRHLHSLKNVLDATSDNGDVQVVMFDTPLVVLHETWVKTSAAYLYQYKVHVVRSAHQCQR